MRIGGKIMEKGGYGKKKEGKMVTGWGRSIERE
jgi:hypothetical protein